MPLGYCGRTVIHVFRMKEVRERGLVIAHRLKNFLNNISFDTMNF